MPKFTMIALTNPVEGREDDYNEWYQHVHLPEIVSYKGVTSARRFKLAAPLQAPFSYGYLAIYDMDTDDLAGLLGRIGADSAAGKNTTTDASDNANAYTVIFNEFGDVVTHDAAVAAVGER